MINKTSNSLEKKIPEIMNLWEQRTLEEVRSAHYQNKLALRNQIPEYLAHLVEALSKTIDRTQARRIFDKKLSTRLGKSHGKERAFSFEYTIDQLILEYHILRQVICDVLEENEILTPIEREVIVCSIEQAVNDSATQFSDSMVIITAKAAKETEFMALVQTRDDFLTVVAHELRTPMTSLQLQAEMLLRNEGQENETNTREIYDFANQVNKQINRLSSLVNNLLDFGRIRSGDYKLEFEKLNICSVISETIDQLDPVFQAFNISPPVFHWQEDANVNIDKARIQQVLKSLITNAVKYGQGQPIRIEMKVLEKNVQIKVIDKGIGIESINLARIFSRFERAISRNEVTGLGLGLYIAKEIILAHGGNIWAESDLGKGSTFFVILPRE